MFNNLINSEFFKSGTILAFLSTLLLFVGFVSGFAQSRVLGIPIAANDFNLYVKLGGEFLIQSIQSLSALPFFYNYINLSLVVLITIISLIVMLVIFRFKNDFFYFQYKALKWLLSYALPILILTLIFYASWNIQKPFFKISSILQPDSTSETDVFQTAINRKTTYNKSKEYNMVINDFYRKKFDECEKKHNSAKCLFDLRTDSNSNFVKETYISFLQISYLFIILIFITIYFSDERIRDRLKLGAYFYIFTQMLSIPYVHGVIGINYIYPVVSITISSEDKKDIQHTGLVYLMNNGNNSYFLDRKNYMSIYSIDNDNISFISQLSKIPLFLNCSVRVSEVKLCEESFW